MDKSDELKKADNLRKAWLKAEHKVSGEEMLILAQSYVWLNDKIKDLQKPDFQILDKPVNKAPIKKAPIKKAGKVKK